MRYLLILFCFFSINAIGQNQINVWPNNPNWYQVKEGEKLIFQLSNSGVNKKWVLKNGFQDGMKLDSAGNFEWTPGFDFVLRPNQSRSFELSVESLDPNNNPVNFNHEIVVFNTNRAPIANKLIPFYLKYNAHNVYKINEAEVYDDDHDPIVFIPNLETFPEGMVMNSKGEISYNPSLSQFNALKQKPSFIEFMVEDQPGKLQTKARLKIETTQIDLPPNISAIPNIEHLVISENETLNIRFYLSDPNGDDDILAFDFLCNQNLPRNCLSKKAENQYEFTWKPAFDFVQEPKDSAGFNIDFFALDKTQKRQVKSFRITVRNAVDLIENDKKNYNIYYESLSRAWELHEQLSEKETQLKNDYKKAKKGKKTRSVINASLGATTGLSSIFTKAPDTQRAISTIGGTTVLTIGTLEATDVIGKSTQNVMERLNAVTEKKNDIQVKGNIFARDFNSATARRGTHFIENVDEFMEIMGLKGLVALELDATWKLKHESSPENIAKTFKDFTVLK